MIDLEHVFSHHPPDPDKTLKYTLVREAAREFATVILDVTPSCADQNAAIRKVREAMMTANAALALDGHT